MNDEALLTQIRMDYYGGADQETLRIGGDKADHFWNWFAMEARLFDIHDADRQEINIGYSAGQCFENAQTESISKGIAYLEGFALIQGRYYLHAFNVWEGKCIDVTALSHPQHFLDQNGDLPNRYIGIVIPIDFIRKYNTSGIDDQVVGSNSLLRSFYMEITGH